MDLSPQQRYLLANQYRILELLDEENAEAYRQQRKVVERGFELLYDDPPPHISKHPVSKEDCRFVLDVLQMYDTLQASYDQLDSPTQVDPEELRFPGFDGNNESGLRSFALYFINDLGRYADLARVEGMNAHRHTRTMYEDMLQELRDQVEGRAWTDLSEDQIVAVLEAGPRPHP